ncbi:MAG TPA: DUF4082 domain-containing protein [Thermoanaerobaculia bacterium]|nr:DUF4082 domain-containing protein [Thermoanaerobaculia bacterium]
MNRLGRMTSFGFAASAMLVLVSASHASQMIQVPGAGHYTASPAVSCDTRNGFVHWLDTTLSFRSIQADSAQAAALQAALNTWTNVSGASHVLSYGGALPPGSPPLNNSDDINAISFVGSVSSPCFGNCLALTTLSVWGAFPGHEIREADIIFNMNRTWNTNGSDDDVQTVATHELGHALGIHHTDVPASASPKPTMLNDYFGTAGRSLEADDRGALQCSEDWYISPVYQGVHETTNCREIKGWARNNKRLSGIAWVQAWTDTLTSKDAAAELYRADVGFHVFSTPPAGNYRTGTTRKITVKYPNGTVMAGSPQNLICQVGIFKNQTPASFIDTGGLDWSVGNVFSSEIPGYVTHLRYYKAAEEAGVHTLKLWTDAGQFLDSVPVDFGSAGSAGWKTGKFPGNGVQIQAGTRYVVTVTTSTKQSKTDCGFSSPIVNGPITGHGGRWQQGSGIFPGTTSCGNFWTDVYFDQ